MTDLSALYTQRTGQIPAVNSAATGVVAPLTSDNPLFAGTGSFFDLIFTAQSATGVPTEVNKEALKAEIKKLEALSKEILTEKEPKVETALIGTTEVTEIINPENTYRPEKTISTYPPRFCGW